MANTGLWVSAPVWCQSSLFGISCQFELFQCLMDVTQLNRPWCIRFSLSTSCHSGSGSKHPSELEHDARGCVVEHPSPLAVTPI